MPAGPSYKITGLVLDKTSRSPASEVSVFCYGNSGNDYSNSDDTTDSNGAFTLDGLMPNVEYHLSVHSEKYAAASTKVTMGNTDVLGVEILVARGGTIKGVVKDAAGNPYPKKALWEYRLTSKI